MENHWSDCAVNNGPAFPAGPCDCGGLELADNSNRSGRVSTGPTKVLREKVNSETRSGKSTEAASEPKTDRLMLPRKKIIDVDGKRKLVDDEMAAARAAVPYSSITKDEFVRLNNRIAELEAALRDLVTGVHMRMGHEGRADGLNARRVSLEDVSLVAYHRALALIK